MSAILFNNQEQQQQLNTTTHSLRSDCAEQTPSTIVSYDVRNGHGAGTGASDDICEEVLDQKMAALELHDVTAVLRLSHQQHNCGDGSDSGVEIVATNCVNVTTLHRALSSTSGGYASSSNGGLDETTHGINNMSCDSSMLSCASDLYEIKMVDSRGGGGSAGNVTVPMRHNYECYSENGSESSSVAAGPTAATVAAVVTTIRRSNNNNNSNSVKKKVAMFEPPGGMHSSISAASSSSGSSQSRSRLSNLKRTASLPRPHNSGHALTLQKQFTSSNSSKIVTATTPTSATSLRGGVTQMRTAPPPSTTKPQKPDSLPTSLSRTQSISMQRLVQRTPSLSRARTPGTPSDDGRWPTVARVASGTAARRGLSVTPDLAAVRMRSSMLAELKPNVSNPYSTLPRRRKQKSVEDLTARTSRSSSITRESRMTSSVVLSSSSNGGVRKNLVNSYGSMTPTQTKMHAPTTGAARSSRKEQQQMPLSLPKTRIYHETSVQTAITSDDLEKAFAGGVINAPRIDAAEQRDQQTQADMRDRELERLRDEVRQLAQREHDLSAKLQHEREEKLQMQRELHLNTERVMACLEMARGGGGGGGTPTSEDGSGHDSLLMLESQIQMSGHELIERQQQIGQLRQLCRSLQLEMERSLAAQACLLHEKATIEQESSELQDFLQHEKAALCDALKELESEYQTSKQQLISRDEEVKVLRDECRHLVRLNEQRRQENRLLQTKYAALETKSKDLIVQQNCSVSGASAALSGLHTRLDSLVEQLVSSYSISEQDLEDIGFQNESTQANSGSLSYDGSNDCFETNQMTKSMMPTSNGLDLPLQLHAQLPQLSSDGSLSPQRNQSFIAAVISAIRNATTPAGKRLLSRHGGTDGVKQRASAAGGGHHQNNQHHQNNNNNHNEQTQGSMGDDSDDSTEMLDSETEPCLMMDNVLEDVTMPDSHSHNMVSSSTAAGGGGVITTQMELPSSELVNITNGCDESLHNLSQAITNRQQMELHVNALSVQKVATSSLQLNPQHCDNISISEDISCHDSVAEMPSLAAEYCSTQNVVDQVIEVDSLVTKLLKVLRLIQMDNDNCIQQLIVDKNKLQQNKEDMLEKLKDLQDINIKLQDELMDATQELMLKNSDLSSTKSEMQRHRNEIDRLTEDICNLSTLCSNYKKLSPSTEFPPFPPMYQNQHSSRTLPPDAANNDVDDEAAGILNLLRMWKAEGQLQDNRVRSFLSGIGTQKPHHDNSERLRIYANQLENVLSILAACGDDVAQDYPALQQLRRDIEIVKRNADWAQLVGNNHNGGGGVNEGKLSTCLYGEDVNANDEEEDTLMTTN